MAHHPSTSDQTSTPLDHLHDVRLAVAALGSERCHGWWGTCPRR
ncbi:hypothetical protein M3J07_008651 [Ascochyta lentis]